MRRAGYGGLRRNVAIALENWLARMDTPDPDAVGRPVEAQENLLHDGIGRPEPSSSRLPQQETRWSLVMPKV